MKVIPACKKIILPAFLIILFGMSVNNVSALSYQNNVDLSFTFNPYITLDVSGDLIIESLVPGSSSDSNVITVSASSNNIVGYDIKATVGDSTNNYTDLRISPSDSTNIFSSLSTNKATLSAFSDDTWGYSYSTDNGTTWVSGNTGSTNTGYNGLPLYTSTGVKLADTSSAGSSTIKFKIGAKASSSKVSGDYTNIINFILTSKVLTTNYTLNYLPNDGNNGQDVSNMPNPATVSNTITNDTNYTLSNSTPTRSGYTFAGWCDGTVTNEACSGTTYQPGATYIIRNTGGSSTINLNAVWEEELAYYNVSFVNFNWGPTAYTTRDGVTVNSDFIYGETITIHMGVDDYVASQGRNTMTATKSQDGSSVEMVFVGGSFHDGYTYTMIMPRDDVIITIHNGQISF